MTIELGQPVTIATPSGPLSGKVVGFENRDCSRHGNGQPKPYLCVATDTDGEWRWFPESVVTA
ncbi:MAG: hypothetical protein ACYC3X_26630 [Pirellulaceae bacterium]